jgi:hypothetical protein
MLDCLEDIVGLPINRWVVKFNTFERRAHKGDGYFVVFRVLLSKDRGIGTIGGKSVKCEVLREIRAHERRSIDYGLLYIVERLVFSRSPEILGVLFNQVLQRSDHFGETGDKSSHEIDLTKEGLHGFLGGWWGEFGNDLGPLGVNNHSITRHNET